MHAHEKLVWQQAHLTEVQAANEAPYLSLLARDATHPLWFPNLLGRWVELEGSASLSAAVHWIRQAQQQQQCVLWIGSRAATVFAPDLNTNAVDLSRLVFVFVPHARAMAAVADELLRSAAFALCVFDLASLTPTNELDKMSAAMETRLLGLAQKYQVALLRLAPDVLNIRMHNASLVSLRVESRHRFDAQQASVVWRIDKDKVRGPGALYNQSVLLVDGLLPADLADHIAAAAVAKVSR